MKDNNELVNNIEKHLQALLHFREDYISKRREAYAIDYGIEEDFDLGDGDFIEPADFLTIRYLDDAIFFEQRVLEAIRVLENADKKDRHNIISGLWTTDSDACIHQEEMRNLLVLIGECYDRISEARNLARANIEMDNYPYADRTPETAIEVLQKCQDNGFSLT